MLPTDFPFRNQVLGKPANMTDEECMSLPVHRSDHGFISKWMLNKEELEEIQRTGYIYIQVASSSHPPICPMVESPFEEGEVYVKVGDKVKADVTLPNDQTIQVAGEIQDHNGMLVLSTEGADIPFYVCKNAEFI